MWAVIEFAGGIGVLVIGILACKEANRRMKEYRQGKR